MNTTFLLFFFSWSFSFNKDWQLHCAGLFLAEPSRSHWEPPWLEFEGTVILGHPPACGEYLEHKNNIQKKMCMNALQTVSLPTAPASGSHLFKDSWALHGCCPCTAYVCLLSEKQQNTLPSLLKKIWGWETASRTTASVRTIRSCCRWGPGFSLLRPMREKPGMGDRTIPGAGCPAS